MATPALPPWPGHGTRTGRMTSSEARFEDVPRQFNGKLERLALHDVDLSAIELRVLASMTDAERQAMLDWKAERAFY
jgi:hypothetical protein